MINWIKKKLAKWMLKQALKWIRGNLADELKGAAARLDNSADILRHVAAGKISADNVLELAGEIKDIAIKLHEAFDEKD